MCPVAKGGKLIRGNNGKRFWSKTVRRENGCIEWTGALTKSGYGKFMTEGGPDGKQLTHVASRWAYAQANGGIPQWMYVLHLCDNPRCVNPEHLTVGDQKENIRQATERGRRSRGSAHHRSKLDEARVKEIRARHANGEGGQSLARVFCVSRGCIEAIVAGRTWKHVE